jgi:hypothetical protein
MAKTRGPARPLLAAAAAAAALHLAAALRAPLGAAGDDALQLLLARNLSHGGFAVPDAWRLCRRLSGEAGAWAAALLVAANPALAVWAGAALPDVPFVAASVGTFLLLSLDDPPLSSLTALAALAALLRPQGAVLAAALAAGLGFKAGPKRAFLFLAGALGPLALWLLRDRFAAGAAAHDHVRLLGGFGAASLLFRAAALTAGLGRGFFGSLPAPAALAGLAASVAAAAWGARVLWRSGSPGARTLMPAVVLYALGLAALHAGWGAWESRDALPFLAPLLPLWGAAFADRISKRRAAALSALLLAAAPGLQRLGVCALEGARTPRTELWPLASAWVRENVPADAAVVTTEPDLLALTTGRRAYPPSPAPSREQWVASLRAAGARFVVVHAWTEGSSSFDDWAVPSPPLALAFSDETENVRILRLD